MTFLHIVDARYLNGYSVWLRFNDGTETEVDLEQELDGPIFEPLKNPDYFRGFTLEGHTVCWPNGADFSPDFLRNLNIQEQSA